MTSPASFQSLRHVLAVSAELDDLLVELGAVQGARLLAALRFAVPAKANPILFPQIEALLHAFPEARTGLGLCAGIGPGAFTGVRIVLSGLTGLAKALGAPLAGLDSLQRLAHGVRFRLGSLFDRVISPHDALVVLTHARTGHVNRQVFDRDLNPVAEPAYRGVTDVLAELAALDRPLHLFGSGLRRNAAAFKPLLDSGAALDLGPEFDSPPTGAFFHAALALDYHPNPPTPRYLRPSDAEAQRDAKNALG